MQVDGEFVGHDVVVAVQANQLAKGMVEHAYLPVLLVIQIPRDFGANGANEVDGSLAIIIEVCLGELVEVHG